MAQTSSVSNLTSVVAKLGPLGTIGSFLLAGSIAFSSWSGKTALNNQTVQSNSQQIQALQKQVTSLQETVAQQLVIANEIKNMKEQQVRLQVSVDRLNEK